MTRISLFVAIFTLGVIGPRAALADEPPPATEEETPPATRAPTPGTLTTPPPQQSPPVTCAPLSGERIDRDRHPGRALRITGGVFIALGIATLVPGAVLTWWGLHHTPSATTTEQTLDHIWMGGAAATAIGGAAFLAGIPMVAAGVHRGHEEQRRSPLAFTPSLGVGPNGAMAGLNFRY